MLLKKFLSSSLILVFCFVTYIVNAEKALVAPNSHMAKQILLMDMSTGNILYEKMPHEKMAPSSMAKIMVCYLIFKRLEDGRLRKEDPLPVSVKAWKMPGTRMFLEPRTFVAVEDLLRGLIVQSGNDASIALAEGVSGDEALFAEEMTQTAHEMGAKNTNFTNASGYEAENLYTTAYDLALISTRLFKDFPQYYSYFAEKEYTYNNIRQWNRNRLLFLRDLNVDGIKTGFTDEGGYGVVVTAEENGRRLLLVINGCKSEKDREIVARSILSWGFREFKSYPLFKSMEVIDRVPVWLGKQNTVAIGLKEDITISALKSDRKLLDVSISFKSPINAPIKKEQLVGILTVKAPHLHTIERPLISLESAEEVGIFGRLISAISFFIWGKGRPE